MSCKTANQFVSVLLLPKMGCSGNEAEPPSTFGSHPLCVNFFF
jgi:hypothetical protein